MPCAQPSPRGDAPSPLAFAKSCLGGDVSVLDPALAWDVRCIYLFISDESEVLPSLPWAVCFLSFFYESEDETAGERTTSTRVRRPRGGIKVAARIGEKLQKRDTCRRGRQDAQGRATASTTRSSPQNPCVVAACRPPIPPLAWRARGLPVFFLFLRTGLARQTR